MHIRENDIIYEDEQSYSSRMVSSQTVKQFGDATLNIPVDVERKSL